MSFLKNNNNPLFIYFWLLLCRFFLGFRKRGLPIVVELAVFSLGSGFSLLQNTGARVGGASVAAACGLSSCSSWACEDRLNSYGT